MNENINLCEILKGHEGETFYCSLVGENVKFQYIIEPLIRVIRKNKVSLDLCRNGGFSPNGECLIFPSKDQRDWNKWLEEQKPKAPKTWSELCATNNWHIYTIEHQFSKDIYSTNEGITSIEKSALALLKIHQLIEVGYGGNITNEERENKNGAYFVYYSFSRKDFIIAYDVTVKQSIAFHTKEQAKEFLKYPENVQLLKDYFMI